MDMQEPNATDDRAPDFDSPWKEAISAYFRPFMALFFPAVQEWIDWSRPGRKARKREIIELLYRYLKRRTRRRWNAVWSGF